MSLRMMRKVMEQQQQAAAEQSVGGLKEEAEERGGGAGRDDDEEEESVEDDEPASRPAAKNSFGVLWSELVQEGEEEEEEEEEEEADQRRASNGDQSSTGAATAGGKKSKKKKNKKKKDKEKKEKLAAGDAAAAGGVDDAPAAHSLTDPNSSPACSSKELSPAEVMAKNNLSPAEVTQQVMSKNQLSPLDGSAQKGADLADVARLSIDDTHAPSREASASAGAAETGDKDASKKEQGPSSGANSTSSSSSSSSSSERRRRAAHAKLVSADAGLLRAEDELKRIFGAKVMREVDLMEASEASSSSRGAAGAPLAGPRGALQVQRRGSRQASNKRQGRVSAGRRFILVQPLDTWPPVEKGGLTMEQVRSGTSSRPGKQPKGGSGGSDRTAHGASKEAGDDVLWFRYLQSPGYTRVVKLLEECVGSHDPNVMVNLVANHPYLAEGLLALSDVYRHIGEQQVAAELLERTLYVLESSWHPYFNPTQGNCRLEYAWEPNRVFFLALFRNIQQLSRRGCHRAAFETSKLLLSLNPEEDPQGMLLCIDYFALRAEQGQWLEEFVETHSNHSLPVMPNFAFSLALAQWRREEGKDESRDQSESLLRDALLLHPYVLPLIVKKAPIQENAEWSKILRSKPFGGHHKMSPTLEHLAALYAERSSLLWRPVEIQKWLKGVASAVVEGMGKKGEVEQDYSNWACVREETFTSTTNEYRHLLLSDFSDNISTVPPEILMGGANGQPMGDGVPGDEDNNRGNRRAGPPPDLEGRNPMMVFLETLMPWNDYGIDPNAQNDRDGQNG